MRRINRLLYAATGPGSCGPDPTSVTPAEGRACTPAPGDEHERDDTRDVWSAWIDLGGEG
jgi:hypothetical protein